MKRDPAQHPVAAHTAASGAPSRRGDLAATPTPRTTANAAPKDGNSLFGGPRAVLHTASGPGDDGAQRAGRPGESFLDNFDLEAVPGAAAVGHRLGELHRTHRDGDPTPCRSGSACTRRHAWRVLCLTQDCDWSDWRGSRSAVVREADQHRDGQPPQDEREPELVHRPGLGWILPGGPR